MNRRRFSGSAWIRILVVSVIGLSSLFTAYPARADLETFFYVTAVNGSGAKLKGACFLSRFSTFQFVDCDEHDGATDGVTTIVGIGTIDIYGFRAPAGYMLAAKKTVTGPKAGSKNVNITHSYGGNVLNLRSVDGSNNLIPKPSCFVITILFDETDQYCDQDDGTRDGITKVRGLRAGTYSVRQSGAPLGYYLNTAVKSASFSGTGGNKTLDWKVTKAPESAKIVITVKNGAGQLLSGDPGAFFQLETTQGVFVGGGCDVCDGAVDGKVVILAVKPGKYVVSMLFPLPGYKAPAKRTVTKVDGTVLRLSYTLQPSG